jgi:hypothetical protein
MLRARRYHDETTQPPTNGCISPARVYFICQKSGDARAYQSAARMLLKNERKKNNTPGSRSVGAGDFP